MTVRREQKMIDTEILHDYSDQARELIDEMDEMLIRLHEAGASGELLYGLFQVVQWLRVCSERFALRRSGILTDTLETLLGRLQTDMVEWHPDMINLLRRSKEMLSTLIEEVARDNEEKTDVSSIVEELECLMGKSSARSSERPEEAISEEVRVLTEMDPIEIRGDTRTIPILEAGSTLGETVPHVLTMSLHLNDLENGIGYKEVRSSILQTVRALKDSLSFVGVPGGVNLLTEMERRIARHPAHAALIPSYELSGLRLLLHDLCGYYPAGTFPCDQRMPAKTADSLTDEASVQVDDGLLGDFERSFQES
jgi:chemotaxis protein histidine kinase CheA